MSKEEFMSLQQALQWGRALRSDEKAAGEEDCGRWGGSVPLAFQP